MKVELEEQEWSQVIAIIANSHPLIAKISTQLVAQRRPNGATQGVSVREDTRTDSPREPEEIAPADRGHSAQQREKGSATKR